MKEFGFTLKAMSTVIMCLLFYNAIAQSMSGINVSPQIAVNWVKSQYPDKDYHYEYGKVPHVLNHICGCDVDSAVFLNNQWLVSNDSLWVVFVDQHPFHNWEHACKFVYLPTSVTDTLSIPSLTVDGNRHPRNNVVNLTPWGINGENIANGTIADSIQENSRLSTLSNSRAKVRLMEDDPLYRGTIEGNKTLAVMVNCAPENSRSNYVSYYNDMEYLFQVLVGKFGIPFYNCNIFVNPQFCANGEDLYGLPFSSFTYDGDTGSCYLSKKPIFRDYFRELQGLLPEEHLFVFFDGHGGYDEESGHYYVELMDDDLYDFELKELLDSIPTKYQTIVMQNCYSGGFISTLEAPGRTIITACDADEESNSFVLDERIFPSYEMRNGYNIFSHLWTSSLNGERMDYLYDDAGSCIDGSAPRPFNADLDSNGRISLEESFVCANDSVQAFFDNAFEHSVLNHYYDNREHAQYSSTPLTVGEDLAFNHIPDSVSLYVRDNVLDAGKEANTTTSIYWNSPDIWTSTSGTLSETQLDGLSQYIEPIWRLSTNLYTYVKLTNRGICDYNGQGKFLHLMWSFPSVNQSPAVWMGQDSSLLGGHITAVEISQSIPVGESRIVIVPWVLPDTIYNKSIADDTEFSFSLLTHISNSPTMDVSEISDSTDLSITPVLNNRDMAQKGFQFSNLKSNFEVGVISSEFAILPMNTETSAVSLTLADDSNSDSLLENYEVELTTEVESGSVLSNIPSNQNTKVIISRKAKKNEVNRSNIQGVVHAILKDENQKIIGGTSFQCIGDTLYSNGSGNSEFRIKSITVFSDGSIQIITSNKVPDNTSISIISTQNPLYKKIVAMPQDSCIGIVSTHGIPDGPCVVSLMENGVVVDSQQILINH